MSIKEDIVKAVLETLADVSKKEYKKAIEKEKYEDAVLLRIFQLILESATKQAK